MHPTEASRSERISRRTLLKATTATAGAIATAAAGFVKGVDISWVPQMEARGFSWKNASGQKQELLGILKGYGITAVRLRTFVNPSNSPTDGHCSINEVAAFAKRVKAAGMSIMKNNDVLPTWVQIGNEINSGIVANMKKISDAYGKPFLHSEFGGRVDRVSSTRAALVAYTKALKANGGPGIFYWEPERMSPFTGYGMGAWDSSTQRPTVIWAVSPRPERRAVDLNSGLSPVKDGNW